MMAGCTVHDEHEHKHGADCGHKAVQHDDHIDYLHDGHLHHMHSDHVDEHALSSQVNQAKCTPGHKCTGHEEEHEHAEGCGHEGIPHGDHVDYIVDGHLHHPCESHCDDHGRLRVAN